MKLTKDGNVKIDLETFSVIYGLLMHVKLGDRNNFENLITDLMVAVEADPDLVDALAEWEQPLISVHCNEDGITLELSE